MFRFSLRKMRKNRWLTLSLFIGYLMAVAIVASMPIYSHAILNRMLQKDLAQVQIQSRGYPGRVAAEASLSAGSAPQKVKTATFHRYDQTFETEILPKLGLPVQEKAVLTVAQNLRVARKGLPEEELRQNSQPGSLSACTGLFDHVSLVEGRLPSGKAENGVLEVAASERALQELDCVLDGEYEIYRVSVAGGSAFSYVTEVKIVGIVEPTDPADLYWVMPFLQFNEMLILDPQLFSEQFVEVEEPLFNKVSWAAALDYTAITPESCASIAETAAYYGDTNTYPPRLRTAFGTILQKYAVRRQSLTAMLWIIEVPILLMLLFYIFMVSRLILSYEKNEIAVLQSRGGAKGQITGVYLLQAVFLSATALVLGPFLGLFFCRVIGASNGFMEFVNRKALPVALTETALCYGAITAGALVLTMLAAVVFSRESSIVSLKRSKSGRGNRPLWQKLFLDVICLAVALYGFYNFKNRLKVVQETGAAASDIPIDFLLYGSSTLFLLGGALLFLRVFPLLVRLIYGIGRRVWGPVLYLTLLNVSRSARQNQMISLFLIFTLSMGVFNAVAVRTLNKNDEDRIRYTVGADITLQEEWPNTGGGSVFGPGGEETASDDPVYYTEPRFTKYEQMKTVSSAARVLTVKKTSLIASSKRVNGLTLMGVVPDEFGRTCWFRNGLLPHHINEYLNLLASEPRALLLSNKVMEENGLSPGDTVYLSIGDNKDSVQFIVYAGIDYFPSFNPNSEDSNGLAVGNLIYLQQETKLEPYRIWLKKAEGVTSAEVYEELTGMGVRIQSLSDATSQVTEMKNDPMTQGINGFFTLSFLVTMALTFVGFFLYWILAIRGRLLQFGILHSMGLSRLSVIFVLLWEQILVSVTAILAGLGLGTLAAELYAPILECNVDAASQVLPFQVAAASADYWRIIGVVAAMMAVAALVLGRTVYRLRAGEALKLGED